MSRRDSPALDWQRGNIRLLRARYEKARHIEPKECDEWRAVPARGRRIRLLVHNGRSPAGRAIVYFHGGGWIAGSPATHADISGALAVASGLPVISVDYRLAPEFAAEAAIEDGLAVLHHLFGAAPGRYGSAILCGDSAGGSLALAVERRAAGSASNVLGVASFYGCFGCFANPALYRAPHLSDGLDAACIRRYWRAANRGHGLSPYSIASLARGDGCPVHLLVAGRDPL
ncbi:MAG: alpha/beta hydrolase fold domain-containing protein [Parvibaculaceae bacterium]